MRKILKNLSMLFTVIVPDVVSLQQGCHFPDNMKFPDFSRPRLSSTVSPRPFRGLGVCSPRKFSKLGYSTQLKMNFRQQNSLTFPWLLEFCRKFPGFQRSLSNSPTFPGFPGQWQPCYNACSTYTFSSVSWTHWKHPYARWTFAKQTRRQVLVRRN